VKKKEKKRKRQRICIKEDVGGTLGISSETILIFVNLI